MSEILLLIMAVFAVVGALDRILGNRLGLGKEFEEGILAMGSLALVMVGIIALAPVLATLLRPVIVPVFSFLGADPAMFAGTILACDMGGGSLALELTENMQAAHLGGVITGSMLGATVVFIIPVAMGILQERDRSLIMLRYFRGKTQTETAKVLGMTQVQVSRRERVVLAQMRKLLIG